MADIVYILGAQRAEVHPVDPVTGRDIEDLGPGTIVELFVPDSRRADVDRNDTTRRELTAITDTAIATTEG